MLSPFSQLRKARAASPPSFIMGRNVMEARLCSPPFSASTTLSLPAGSAVTLPGPHAFKLSIDELPVRWAWGPSPFPRIPSRATSNAHIKPRVGGPGVSPFTMSQSSSPPDPAFSASSDINMDAAVIGIATAGSVFLVLLTIFVGYWLTTRRKRRSAEEAFDPHLLIAESKRLLKPFVPAAY